MTELGILDVLRMVDMSLKRIGVGKTFGEYMYANVESAYHVFEAWFAARMEALKLPT